MNYTLDLFSGRYPDRAGAKEGTTSREAADQIEASGRAGRLRAEVLAWYSAGHIGTADECAMALDETILSIRPRVSELHKQHKLKATGIRRLSQGGRMAHVWRSI